MPGVSTTGLPYLLVPDQTTEIADTSRDLVEKVEAQDRTAFTTLTRDAIPAGELWVGRRVWNVTVGAHQVCIAVNPAASPPAPGATPPRPPTTSRTPTRPPARRTAATPPPSTT